MVNLAVGLCKCGCCSIGCCWCCIDNGFVFAMVFATLVLLFGCVWMIFDVCAVELNDVTFEMASICDRSPSWHSTSNSIVSGRHLSSLSHWFSENRRYKWKNILKKLFACDNNQKSFRFFHFDNDNTHLTIFIGDIFGTSCFTTQNTLWAMTSKELNWIETTAFGRNEYGWIYTTSGASFSNYVWRFIWLPSMVYMLIELIR